VALSYADQAKNQEGRKKKKEKKTSDWRKREKPKIKHISAPAASRSASTAFSML
jgi:hypothetical protein